MNFRSGFRWILLAALFSHVTACGYPGSTAHASVSFTTEVIGPGTVAAYTCDNGFELLGPARRSCSDNGTWVPLGIPFCVLNVAAGKAPMQSSIVGKGIAQKAIDGSTSTFFNADTCTMTEAELSPWWYVNLLEPYMVQLVRVDFGTSCCTNNRPATIVVRVGNNRPDLGVNAICNKFTGFLEEGRPLFLPCNTAMPGAFVSIHLEGPPGNPLSICETFVYTDQALPIERCPSYRDQPLGSTATYNGKCYIFYNNQPRAFRAAEQFCKIRGGSLVDETNPALQGFLSWELFRRHRNDPGGQYWMGATRDSRDPNNWKWINGQDVTISFWNKPETGENCSRFDGSKGWLWSDTNCNLNLNFICQHRPAHCGRPEVPANATIIARNFDIGSVVEYRCDRGHLLVGPNIRTCLANGFFSEFPPKCRYLECGPPARIHKGGYKLVNGTRHYLSMLQYYCHEGHVLVGKSKLICDVDEKWNGPPPRCDPIFCRPPPPVADGGFALSKNSTEYGVRARYFCNRGFIMIGKTELTCVASGYWDGEAPVCQRKEVPTTTLPPPTRKSPPTPPSPTVQVRPTYIPHRNDDLQPSYPRPTTVVAGNKPNVATSTRVTPPLVSPTPTHFSSTSFVFIAPTPRPTSAATRTPPAVVERQHPHLPFVEAPSNEAPTVVNAPQERPAVVTTPASSSRHSNRPPLHVVTIPALDSTSLTPTRRPHPTPPVRPRPVSATSTPPTRPSVPETPIITAIHENEIKDEPPVHSKDKTAKHVERAEEPRGIVAAQAKLNMGGIIALGVFGGFILIAITVTLILIFVRRIH